MVEKISAVSLRVANMRASVRFYKDVLGLDLIYGSEGSYFTSLRTKDGYTILNLEHGNASIRWGRLIFHVSVLPACPDSKAAMFEIIHRPNEKSLGPPQLYESIPVISAKYRL